MKCRHRTGWRRGFVGLVAFIAVHATCSAAVKTWNGSGENWNTANWTPSAPVAGDAAVIDGDIALTNATPILGSYTLNAGNTHTFSGSNAVLRATNVVVRGALTHSAVTTTNANGSGDWIPDGGVSIVAYADVSIESDGSINVDAKGYPSSYGENTGLSGYDGYGPGAGLQYYGGGGHGGRGGGDTVGGATNGSVSLPRQAGSSGGGHSAADEGGAGGGVVSIEAIGDVTIDGTISAEGETGHGQYGSGGAGGSICVSCATVAGSGRLQANGGNRGTNLGGGGGGGRIALVYTNPVAQALLGPQFTFGLLGRDGRRTVSVPHNGDFGTLYFPGADVLPAENMGGGFFLIIPSFTNWAPDSFTISNGVVRFEDGFHIAVTNQARLDSSGGLDLRANAQLACGSLLVNHSSALYMRDHSDLKCSGDVTITNGGALHLHAGSTNGTGYGASVAVTGTLVVATGSYIYPYAEPTNGGVVRISVGSALIAAGGKIDADGLGYEGSSADGYGPGAGKQYYAGAGHGGQGGAHPSWPANAGATYGSTTVPVQAGSSGGGHSSGNEGGAGGGAVIIRTARTGALLVNGSISADGNPGRGDYGSGGAGGTVYIDCGTFTGTGLITARGGSAATLNSRDQPSGGGGGRIAVWRVLDSWAGAAFATNVAVKGGTVNGAVGTPGTNGTIYLGQNAEPFGPPTITNLPPTNVLAGSATVRGSVTITGQTTIVVSVFWGETDGGTDYGSWDHTNTFSGHPGVGLIETNLSLTANTAYTYRFYATNAADHAWGDPAETFNTGELWVEATDPVASEDGPEAGTVVVHRATWATNVSLTVLYSLSGSASNGIDYTSLNGQVSMAKGVSNVSIVVSALPDAETSEPVETAILQLELDEDRTYRVQPMNSATVTIANAGVDPTNSWTGTGNWTNTAHWSANHVPVQDQHVVVAGHVTLGYTTPVFASYFLTAGATNTFAGTNAVVKADDITVHGTLTHTSVSVTNANGSGLWIPDSRVCLQASGDLTLTASSRIDVDGKGYPASYGEHTGPTGHDGYGPGAGLQHYGGGGHGGHGGGDANGGETNGSVSVPFQAGSSGCGHSVADEGGAGGGVVRLEAGGNLTLDGTISAEGLGGRGQYGSGGAGGSVYASCAVVTGTGLVRANGGERGTVYGAGGGGGRIALVYTNSAGQRAESPSLTLQVSGRSGISSSSVASDGEFGTVYFPDTAFLPRESMSGGFRLVIPGFSSWAPGSLTITNGILALPGVFALAVTNGVQLAESGGLELEARSSMSCSDLTVGSGGRLHMAGATNLACSGSLVVTNGGELYLQGAPTNAGPAEACGLLVTVGENLLVTTDAVVYVVSDGTNGGSVLFSVRDLTVDAGGRIDADGQGFRGGDDGVMGWRAPLGTLAGLGNGFGPGAGLCHRGGGGYGGRGGDGNIADRYGPTYGASNAPVDLGSGGGYGGDGRGGSGGGLVRVQAVGTIRIDGTVSADGRGGSNRGGGGSGGGVYLQGYRFEGVGLIQARGGDAGDAATYGGGGGGGRIAVWRIRDNWLGTSLDSNRVARGAGILGQVGEDGTVVVVDTPRAMGTMILIR